MKNILTFHIESWLGAVFVLGLAGFFIGFLFITMRNFNSDMSMSLQQNTIKIISPTERELMEKWMSDNGIKIPEGKSYLYLIQSYPNKPWLLDSNF